MVDPVAEKSGFLRMYMSNHPDTLVAYAKWFGKVQDPIKSAEMAAIDSKSMTLVCTFKNGEKRDVRVPIEPPLKGYEDVKPRLLEMKAFAQEGLGMIKVPKINQFFFPRQAVVSSCVILFFVYLYHFVGAASPWARLANLYQEWLGSLMIVIPYWTTLVLHVGEALYTSILCRKHSTGLVLGAAYVLATLIAGYPIWTNLRKKIQEARIDSVMKIQ